MFSSFRMRSDAAGAEARPDPLVQSPPVSSSQLKKMIDNTLLDAVATLSRTNGMTVVQHGARVAVIGELLVAMLEHLPVSMRADIVASFRNRIEDLMSLGDDRSLPEQYHSALLTEVNRYLNALR